MLTNRPYLPITGVNELVGVVGRDSESDGTGGAAGGFGR